MTKKCWNSSQKKRILRTADAQTLEISRPYFLEFIQKHGYEKMAHGIYLSPDAWEDGMYILQSRCPHVVFFYDKTLKCPLQESWGEGTLLICNYEDRSDMSVLRPYEARIYLLQR